VWIRSYTDVCAYHRDDYQSITHTGRSPQELIQMQFCKKGTRSFRQWETWSALVSISSFVLLPVLVITIFNSSKIKGLGRASASTTVKEIRARRVKARHFHSISEYNRQRRHFATLQENISSTYELVLIRTTKKNKKAYPPDRHAHQGHAA
jgi:hypothetical protein